MISLCIDIKHFDSSKWSMHNSSLQYQYNIKQICEENKENIS